MSRQSSAQGSAARTGVRFCLAPDGVRIAYTVHGSGPPLVATTCWLTHLHWESPVFAHFFEAIGAYATVIRYDDRGFGLSDRETEDFSLDARLGDLEAVVAACGHERFALLGHSAGGPVAVGYTVAHPERVTRLILNGAHATPARRPLEQDEFDTMLHLARVAWSGSGARYLRVYSSGLLPTGSEEQLSCLDDIHRRNSSAETSVRAAVERRTTDVTGLLERVTAPTLVLHSRGDRMISVDEGRLLATRIPGARFVALDSDNHVLLADEPQWPALLAQVAAFLEPDRDDRRQRPGTATDALTPREVEVLRLAADGLDNRAIATHLTLSVRTVERHLSNAYRKLGVAGKSARAAAVARVVYR